MIHSLHMSEHLIELPLHVIVKEIRLQSINSKVHTNVSILCGIHEETVIESCKEIHGTTGYWYSVVSSEIIITNG